MKRLAMKRRLRASSPALVISLIALFVALAGIAASPVAGVTVATGTLEMNTSLSLVSQLGGCAPVGSQAIAPCVPSTAGSPDWAT